MGVVALNVHHAMVVAKKHVQTAEEMVKNHVTLVVEVVQLQKIIIVIIATAQDVIRKTVKADSTLLADIVDIAVAQAAEKPPKRALVAGAKVMTRATNAVEQEKLAAPDVVVVVVLPVQSVVAQEGILAQLAKVLNNS